VLKTDEARKKIARVASRYDPIAEDAERELGLLNGSWTHSI
jgi:hypothetical protein